MARPGVVWFGEELPAHPWDASTAAVEKCDAFISIGTSGVVFPAAYLPIEAACRGAAVIHVNQEHVPVKGDREISLVGQGGAILPQLLASPFG